VAESDLRMKALLVYDVHLDTPKGRIGWAYWRKQVAIARHAPPDFDVELCQYADIPWNRMQEFDCVLSMEYSAPLGRQFTRRGIRGVVNITMFNKDSNSRFQLWKQAYEQSDFVICSTMNLFEHCGRLPHTCHIANGVCTDTFNIQTHIQDREHRVWWRGSSNPKKTKGWSDILVPAIPKLEKLGFIVDFKPVNEIVPEQVLTTPEMIEAYNASSYAVCTSMSEGAPSSILEAAACGCVVVSTNVGNLPEWGENDVNCCVIPRSVDGLVEGLCRARENREKLSAAGAETMRSKWSYGAPGHRAQHFYSLLRRCIEDGPDSVKPFSWMDTPPEKI
jgi:hypothetical protein